MQEDKGFDTIRCMKQHNDTMSNSQTITMRRCQSCIMINEPLGRDVQDVGRATVFQRCARILTKAHPKRKQRHTESWEYYMTHSKAVRCQTENLIQ